MRPQPSVNSVSPQNRAREVGNQKAMCPRVWPGNIEDLGDFAADRIVLALPERDVDVGDALAVGRAADDEGAGRRLQRGIAARVVPVVMGVEDMAQAPAGFLERGEHRVGDGRVDHRSAPLAASCSR